MKDKERTAVLLLAHGTPDALSEVPEYLRNVTSGTASFTMEPSHYAPVKEELADIRKTA